MRVNPLRTGLSTLGVIMGIASVIATLALADGLERYARQQVAAKTDVQSITVTSKTEEVRDGFLLPNQTYAVFHLYDAQDLRTYLTPGTEVTMTIGGEVVVTAPVAAPREASLTATLANYLNFGMKNVEAGRYFTEAEVAHDVPVVVLSHKLAAELSPDRRAASMLGRQVRIHGRTFTTVGVMPSVPGETTFQVFLPLRAAALALGLKQAITPAIVVRAPSIEEVDETRNQIIDWLATRYRDWDRRVSIAVSLERLEETRRNLATLRLVLGAFASIALVVGGVGIMNVLLASVAERTREIGVRKALGARKRDILVQFLAESVAVAFMGTSIGTAVGLSLAFAAAWVVRWRVPTASLYAAFTPATLGVAILSAVTIGLTFGTYPALIAARLSPIDAIRHE